MSGKDARPQAFSSSACRVAADTASSDRHRRQASPRRRRWSILNGAVIGGRQPERSGCQRPSHRVAPRRDAFDRACGGGATNGAIRLERPRAGGNPCLFTARKERTFRGARRRGSEGRPATMMRGGGLDCPPSGVALASAKPCRPGFQRQCSSRQSQTYLLATVVPTAASASRSLRRSLSPPCSSPRRSPGRSISRSARAVRRSNPTMWTIPSWPTRRSGSAISTACTTCRSGSRAPM